MESLTPHFDYLKARDEHFNKGKHVDDVNVNDLTESLEVLSVNSPTDEYIILVNGHTEQLNETLVRYQRYILCVNFEDHTGIANGINAFINSFDTACPQLLERVRDITDKKILDFVNRGMGRMSPQSTLRDENEW